MTLGSGTAALERSRVLGEAPKLLAFFRRDLVIALSYRMAFVGDWASLALQALMFYFIGRIVDPSRLPAYGGSHATYMEFAAVGIALGTFIQIALHRVAAGIRAEQMLGTLESLLMTPTAPATIQVGTVFYDLVYVPIRSGVFLLLIAIAFGLDFHASGIAPAVLVLLAFVPVVWGMGVASAGLTLTFRRGGGFSGLGIGVLTVFSGAYFPLGVLPSWVQGLAGWNPVAIAVDGMREPLLAGTGWAGLAPTLAELSGIGIVSLVGGIAVFRAALRRERRRGSLGLY